MGVATAIQWCDHTFNPWIGCTKVAAGCAHCYAEAEMDHRRGRAKWGVHGTRSVTSAQYWGQPKSWDLLAASKGVRARVFCASLADVFEDWPGVMVNHKGERVGFSMGGYRQDLWALIEATPNLDWLLVTKRPEHVRSMLPLRFLGNVWLLTSVSDQVTFDVAVKQVHRWRGLAGVFGLSVEPLLGPVDVGEFVHKDFGAEKWVIVGGESGSQARLCQRDWVRGIVDQCDEAEVACFVKQMGANARPAGYEHAKGGDPAEWPEEYRVREFPAGFGGRRNTD